MLGDRRDRDPCRAGGVQRAQIGKQMRRSLNEVSGRRKIEARARRAASQRAGKIKRGLIR